jgi:hypothetical protein
MAKTPDPFFVGWGKIPKGLKPFMVLCTVLFIAGFGMGGFLISSTQADTGSGAFMGQASATGVLRFDPYPVLHVTQSDDYDVGDVVLLTGGGKRGLSDRAAMMNGSLITVSGARLERGNLNGMQLRNGMRGLRRADGDEVPPEIVVEPLGRWKLTGEICDGKCLGGAMRPGTGLAHKACANLCLIGGVPPVFVSSGPVEGEEFLLLADAGGMSVTQEILDYTATFVEVEGDIERRGGMLVFKIAPDTIRLAP